MRGESIRSPPCGRSDLLPKGSRSGRNRLLALLGECFGDPLLPGAIRRRTQRDQIESGRHDPAAGGGYVDYFGVAPDTGARVPKVSYAGVYQPWGWYVG